VLSTDADHLDIYGDAGAVRKAYLEFLDRTSPKGTMILPEKLKAELTGQELDGLAGSSRRIEWFGTGEGSIRAENIRVEDGMFCFEYSNGMKRITIELPLPGRHNVMNALVAIRMAELAGMSLENIKEKMALFKGIKRRFEWIHRSGERVYIDDYAHHPTELSAAIGAARELYPGRQILGIFQPHLYSRTRDFLAGFAQALAKLDRLVLLDIYPAREKPIPGVSSKVLFDQVPMDDKQWMTMDQVIGWLEKQPLDIVMTLGAGDIDLLVPGIKEVMENAK
jgi:UDP-N-acetylmuramate--alanine ligase